MLYKVLRGIILTPVAVVGALFLVAILPIAAIICFFVYNDWPEFKRGFIGYIQSIPETLNMVWR